MSDADPASADPSTAPAAVPDRRGYAVALSLLVLGAVLLLVGFGRTWSTTTVGGSGLPSLSVPLTGTELTPAGTAIAVLALAGVAGLVAARRRGRVVIGVLLALAGLAAGYVAVDFAISWHTRSGLGETIIGRVSDQTGVDVGGAPTTITQWWLAAALGGALVTAGGVIAVLRSASWPEMGRRYERSGAEEGRGAVVSPESVWEQLDRGVDPTVERPADSEEPRGWDGGAETDTMSGTPPEEEPR